MRWRPILLTYGYQQSFRYRPCLPPEYLAYIQKILRFALRRSRPTSFTSIISTSTPNPIRATATPRQRISGPAAQQVFGRSTQEAFGFDVVDYVNPPLWNADNPPSRLKLIFDPVLQEWIDFRCQMMRGRSHEDGSLRQGR